MTVLRGAVRCPCGFVHDLIEVPCPTTWRAFRDTEGFAWMSAHRTRERLARAAPGTPDYEELIEADRVVERLLTFIFECPTCGRLVWNRGEDQADIVYAREQERA